MDAGGCRGSSPRLRRRVFLAVGGFAALSAAGYLLLGSPVSSRDTWPVGEVCSYCGMKIVERKFAAELLVDGKRLAYDDPGCMVVHYLSFTGAIQPVQGVWPLAKVEKAVVYTYDGEEPVSRLYGMVCGGFFNPHTHAPRHPSLQIPNTGP
jgi:hypothetical protein